MCLLACVLRLLRGYSLSVGWLVFQQCCTKTTEQTPLTSVAEPFKATNTNIYFVFVLKRGLVDSKRRKKKWGGWRCSRLIKKKKATIIPHSDLTLEWLHSIQPGKGGRGSCTHKETHTHARACGFVCVNSETHEERGKKKTWDKPTCNIKPLKQTFKV